MDRNLGLDGERECALAKWKAQADDLQRLLLRLQTSFVAATGPFRVPFEDWNEHNPDSKQLLSELMVLVGKWQSLITLRQRLEKTFTKKVHKIEVTIGVVASRRIHEAWDLSAEFNRAKDEAGKAADLLLLKYGLARLPDFTRVMIDTALKRFYPS